MALFCETERICLMCYLVTEGKEAKTVPLKEGLCPDCDREELAQRHYIRERQAACSGCKEGLNNQEGHMGPTGCLSSEDE